jgi:Ca-activated chloride channel homolog
MRNVICIFSAAMAVCLHLPAQVSGGHESFMSSAHIVVPQARSALSSFSSSKVDIMAVEAGVEISEQVATTTLDIILTNAGHAALEAQLAVPVPEGAALRGFTFQGTGKEPVAELLQREEARRAYDAIVAKAKDPAILEFVGCNLIRSSVFPVAARSGQKVRVIYENLLPRDGDRIDYFLPRSESVDYMVPWRIAVRIKSRESLGTVYSPSHGIETVRLSPSRVTARLTPSAETQPGPFRISCLLKSKEMTASLMAYPSAEIGGGYFLLLATPPERSARAASIKREVILVIDRSGSMAGEKLEQARAAALQVLEGLEDGERFNLVVYNEGVECFASQPLRRPPRQCARLEVFSGTCGFGVAPTFTMRSRRPCECAIPAGSCPSFSS